jgi:hypothetical protein
MEIFSTVKCSYSYTRYRKKATRVYLRANLYGGRLCKGSTIYAKCKVLTILDSYTIFIHRQ